MSSARARLAVGLAFALAAPGDARGDLLPEPSVPAEWEEHPAPLPEPPPEKPVDWAPDAAPSRTLPLMLLALALALALTRRRAAPPRIVDDATPT
ncbi:MAG: hypothetical protein R3B09_26185 [Nannocystaceae bacterium]